MLYTLCFNEVVSNSVHYYIINYFRHAEYALVPHPGTDRVFADTLNLFLWIYNKNKRHHFFVSCPLCNLIICKDRKIKLRDEDVLLLIKLMIVFNLNYFIF